MNINLQITQATCPNCGELKPLVNGEIQPHGNCRATAVTGSAVWRRIGQRIADNGRWISGRDK